MEVFIVVKESEVAVTIDNYPVRIRTNEGVFLSEEKAKQYISDRVAAKDRDDMGCQFTIEPWYAAK